MFLKGISTLAVVLVSVGIGTSTAHANPFRHIDEVALAVKSDAARAANEIRYHYRGSAEYEHLYNDAVEMYQLAGHIHELTHSADCLDRVQADVAQLDELVHHLQEVALQVSAQPVPYGYGHGVSYGHGYGYGYGVPAVGPSYHSNRLSQILAVMADNVHHLEADLGGSAPPVAVPAPVPLPAPLVVPGPAAIPGPAAGPFYRSPGAASVEFSKGKNRFAVTLGR